MPVVPTSTPRMPDLRRGDVVYAAGIAGTTATVTGAGVFSSWLLVELMLGIALVVTLLGAALGATPPWALEWPAVLFVYKRRDALIFAGLGIALGLLMVLAVTGWSA